MSAWRMAFRAGKNGDEMWPQCKALGVATIEYDPIEDIDFSRYPEGEPKEAWSQLAPTQQASLKRLVYSMQEGVDVIYVKQGPKIVGKGVVTGPYQFDKKGRVQAPNGEYYRHQRPVNWIPDFPEVRIQLGRSQQMVVEPLTREDVRRIEKASRIRTKASSGPHVADESDIEGLRAEFLTIKTKRSRRLRNRAFDEAKGICAVCERDFAKFLGGRGIRVLQVHHREQLSARASPAITKLADLVVVCANCHLLLHLNSQKTLSVGKLRRLLQNDGYLAGAMESNDS